MNLLFFAVIHLTTTLTRVAAVVVVAITYYRRYTLDSITLLLMLCMLSCFGR